MCEAQKNADNARVCSKNIKIGEQRHRRRPPQRASHAITRAFINITAVVVGWFVIQLITDQDK